MLDEAEKTGPVTISISRHIVPGRENDYEAWLQGITAEALTFPGHMGVNVIRPRPPSTEYVTIFRFDNYQHSRDWEESAVRADWLARLEGITEGKDAVQKATGLEFWFSLPELPAARPSPHKMALVLLVVVFVLVFAINLFLLPPARPTAGHCAPARNFARTLHRRPGTLGRRHRGQIRRSPAALPPRGYLPTTPSNPSAPGQPGQMDGTGRRLVGAGLCLDPHRGDGRGLRAS